MGGLLARVGAEAREDRDEPEAGGGRVRHRLRRRGPARQGPRTREGRQEAAPELGTARGVGKCDDVLVRLE